MKNEITAVILAGGNSSRMGSDKSLLKLGGKALIEHVVDALRAYVGSIVIVTNDKEKYSFLSDVSFVSDIIKNQGPFIGLISGLKSMDTNWFFVTSCDMPLIDGNIIEYLSSKRTGYIVSPFSKYGYEPLISLYSKEVLYFAEKMMTEGIRSINKFIAKMEELGYVDKIEKNILLELFGENILLNINDREDYLKLTEVFYDR